MAAGALSLAGDTARAATSDEVKDTGWSSDRICRLDAGWKSSAFPDRFYCWYDQYQRGGPGDLADRPSWRIGCGTASPEAIRCRIVDLALGQPEFSPRELPVRFTDEEIYFVSEASVYRLLKAHNLITALRESPP